MMTGESHRVNDISGLDPFEAEKVVETFRRGTVPTDHLDVYSLGRDRWLQAVERDLDFVSRGGSKVRFLAAPYGGGKTHFLRLVTQEAFAKRFLVSYVELHSREAPFDRFEAIFPKVMRELRDPNSRSLESILENWARSFPHYAGRDVEEALRTLAPALDFRAAIRAVLQYANTDSPTHRSWLQGIVSWLEGMRPGTELTKVSGIRSGITIGNVSEVMASFLRFIRSAGYSGLVVLLDEAEAITSLAQSRKRDEANQNIRKLLDNADENVGLYLLFATTPRFLKDAKTGAQSYPALWSRIRDVVDAGFEQASSRSIVMVLPPFTEEELVVCAERLVVTHACAYGWNARERVSVDEMRRYVTNFLDEGNPRIIRPFIRGLIHALDLMEESRDSLSAGQAR